MSRLWLVVVTVALGLLASKTTIASVSASASTTVAELCDLVAPSVVPDRAAVECEPSDPRTALGLPCGSQLRLGSAQSPMLDGVGESPSVALRRNDEPRRARAPPHA